MEKRVIARFKTSPLYREDRGRGVLELSLFYWDLWKYRVRYLPLVPGSELTSRSGIFSFFYGEAS